MAREIGELILARVGGFSSASSASVPPAIPSAAPAADAFVGSPQISGVVPQASQSKGKDKARSTTGGAAASVKKEPDTASLAADCDATEDDGETGAIGEELDENPNDFMPFLRKLVVENSTSPQKKRRTTADVLVETVQAGRAELTGVLKDMTSVFERLVSAVRERKGRPTMADVVASAVPNASPGGSVL